MKYMLLIYGDKSPTDKERADCTAEGLEIIDRLRAQGKFVDAAPLEPVSTAVTVRVRDGQMLVTDGPFAETTEQLGGYFVLDLADLDEAIAVASGFPPARWGAIEIRPIVALDGLPPGRPAFGGTHAFTPFLLMCYDNEAAWRAAGDEARRAAMGEAVVLTRQLAQDGSYLSAAPLHPAATATCVRVRDGKRAVTDGPFAETHEVLGGYYLIQAASREAAVRVAARHPGARLGSVEVRAVIDLSRFRDRL